MFGGIHNRLNVSLDLESFSCPKAEHLFDDLVWLETYGNRTEPNAYQHCAKVEVEAFGHWLANQKAETTQRRKKQKKTKKINKKTKKNPGSFKKHQIPLQ